MRSLVATLHVVGGVAALVLAVSHAVFSGMGAPLLQWIGGPGVIDAPHIFLGPVEYVAVGVFLEILFRFAPPTARQPGEITWSNMLSRVLLAIGAVVAAVTMLQIARNWTDFQTFVLSGGRRTMLQPLYVLAWGAAVEYLSRIANASGASPDSNPPFAGMPRLFIIAAIVAYVATALFYWIGASQTSATAGAPDYTLTYVLVWVTGPVALLGWAGLIHQVGRVLGVLASRRSAETPA